MFRESDGLVRAAENRRFEMIQRLETLVSCESPSECPSALARCGTLLLRWLEAALRRTARLVESGDRVHLLAVAEHTPAVLLLGHFDTVWPEGTLADWPFTVTNGIASGPGVFDMKAGIVQMISALELLDDTSQVSVLLTSDEEIGAVTSRALIEDHARLAGAVLVCEPSADGGAVKIGRKGVASYKVDVQGRAAHAGLEPWLGVNATVELAHQILAIREIADGSTTVTPTVLAAGTTVNTVPAAAHVDVDVRAWTRGELERVDRAMRHLTPQLAAAAVRVTGGIDRYPFESSAAMPLLGLAEAAAEKIGLKLPKAERSAGGSDGNFTAAIGIPTLDGLGAVGAHPHGRDEYVDVTKMPERAALLATLVQHICAEKSGQPS